MIVVNHGDGGASHAGQASLNGGRSLRPTGSSKRFRTHLSPMQVQIMKAVFDVRSLFKIQYVYVYVGLQDTEYGRV